jgi:hypothetical protein
MGIELEESFVDAIEPYVILEEGTLTRDVSTPVIIDALRNAFDKANN